MNNDMSTFEEEQIQSSSTSAPENNTEQPLQQQQDMMKGKFCSVYEGTAPRGCKLKFFNPPGRNNAEIEIIAAKLNSIKLNTEKDPITKLNEIMLILKKKVVTYETIDIKGLLHSPIYTVRAQNEDLSVFGTGPSKKEAKKIAAIAFIERMNFNNVRNDITSIASNNMNNPYKKKPTDPVLENKKSEINPIGQLQEVCMIYHWKLPSYEYTTQGNTGFEANCLLYMYKTSSVQKSKQLAKREAARLMYDKIKEFSENEINCLSLNIYPTPSSIMFQMNISANKNNNSDLLNTSENMKNVEKFLNNLKMSKNPSLNKLKDLNFTKYPGSAVEILDQIGEEEGFTTSYVLLSKPAFSQAEILVQVSITPLIIHLGTGSTLIEAQEAAANVALIYMKLFLE
ncbi:Double-stranded RNA-binding domain [Cinara cedri]|uniref:Double-stranded RNA-binding domain n=1 Tax=Cinara cedri TaxID=506608 RepID=A0A5E4M8R2_9HEMI|nr:Double-stranded RNA-binding domain [Cinara cedri]